MSVILPYGAILPSPIGVELVAFPMKMMAQIIKTKSNKSI